MPRKKKKSRHATGNITRSQQIGRTLALISARLDRSDYKGVIETGQKLLNYLPQGSQERADVLEGMGVAYNYLHQYHQAYDAFTEALSIHPNKGNLWFNRGMVDSFVNRLGLSVRDFERAVELLEKDDPLASDAQTALRLSTKDARKAMKEHGQNFTLDQLIEFESLYQEAMALMAAKKWEEAEQTLRRVIAMSDIHPQPWGNLGFSLIQQQRYDEAEAAWKRALEIDRHYSVARMNLMALEKIRQGEQVSTGRLVESYEGNKVKKRLVLNEEKLEK
jgi:tetratricopeptide (TPR) repeat protein